MPAALTEKEFSRHLNTKFFAQVDEQTFEFELVGVKGYSSREIEQPGLERFSLFFEGPDRYLPQNTYSLQHDQMGNFEIFLVPITKEGEKFRYEAVFNYYLQSAEQ